MTVGNFIPSRAKASVLDDLFGIVAHAAGKSDLAGSTPANINLQTMSLPTPALNIDPAPATGGGEVVVVDATALMPNEGPSGTIADIVKPKNGTISTYIVQPGDTLSSIAQMFGVSTGTILSANDLSRSAIIKPGDELVILPVTGLQYTVRKGDTVESIAKKFNGDVTEIESFNNVDNTTLAAGMSIIIPNAEGSATPALASKSSSASSKSSARSASSKVLQGKTASCDTYIPDADNPAEPSHNVGPIGTCAQDQYYIAPLSHYIQTQDIHGYNAVDLAAPSGTPIIASASGYVVVARAGGWNGGYGSYVVIQHSNGSQTLYAHMSRVAAYDGEHVVQGQVIGYVGVSGDTTGPHVHFEIRNGIRNPF